MSWLRRFLDAFAASEPDDGPPRGDPERVAAAERVLDGLAPLVGADGGEIRLVEVADDGRITVRLSGACRGCQASPYTLQGALEPRLREELPWFQGLRAI
jgi:Fe-S cluster biogenesis protein NfuA